MANYELVTLEARTVTGIGTRTANDAPDMGEKIGGVWRDYFRPGGACEQLGQTHDAPCYGLYYQYTADGGSYNMLAAAELHGAPVPEGFESVTIPAGRYAKFSFRGDVREDTGKFWEAVWQTPLPRAMAVDFEEYPPCADMTDAPINIYIGLADICQSCGMPMTQPEQYGTAADGAPCTDYCVYCYEKGAFKADCTMEQMIDFCLDIGAGEGLYEDREKARSQMLEYYPTLARWRK